MKNILLFPYHHDIDTIIEHKQQLHNFGIAGVISYFEDQSKIDELNKKLNINNTEYKCLLKSCDAVLLLDNYRGFKLDKYYNVIDDALFYNKEVLITPLAAKQLNLLNYQGKYSLLEKNFEEYNDFPLTVHTIKEKYNIDVPIIGIIGQGINTDKFKTQLFVKKAVERDYKVTTITSNSLGALFGCYTMPRFLFENISFEEKILRFNHYICQLYDANKSDVFVIGIPEGIAPFASQEFHHFAEYPLVISTALSIDIAVLCTYLMIGEKLEYGLNKIMDFCFNKFNIPIGLVAISRTFFDIPQEEYESIIFEHPSNDFLEKYYPNVNKICLPMINITNESQALNSINQLLLHLQNNVDVL